MVNSFIEAVKLYWENLKSSYKNKEMFWDSIYTCICKMIPEEINKNKCPKCNNEINYDIKEFKYCNKCGQKLKSEVK